MGVITCDRPNCDNIMCDIRLDEFDICNQCFEEFKKSVASTYLDNDSQISHHLKTFMETCISPRYSFDNSAKIEKYLKRYGSRWQPSDLFNEEE